MEPRKAISESAKVTISIHKIVASLIGTIIVGNFIFLWNVNSDLTKIRTLHEERKRYDEKTLEQLQNTDERLREGLAEITARLDAFDGRITTLEVIIGLRGKSK